MNISSQEKHLVKSLSNQRGKSDFIFNMILKLPENMLIICWYSMIEIIKTEEEDACQEPIKSERQVWFYL